MQAENFVKDLVGLLRRYELDSLETFWRKQLPERIELQARIGRNLWTVIVDVESSVPKEER